MVEGSVSVGMGFVCAMFLLQCVGQVCWYAI